MNTSSKHFSFHTVQNLPSIEMAGNFIPAILVNEEDSPILLEVWWHLTCREFAGMSPAWRNKAVWTIGRFYDWYRVQQNVNASNSKNQSTAQTPGNLGAPWGNRLVDSFLRALEFGTIQHDGSDPTNLRWDPVSAQSLSQAKIHLKAFLEKLPDHVGDNPLSASRFAKETASSFDSSRSVLFHISGRKTNRGQNGRGRSSRNSVVPVRAAKAFPTELLPALIWEGCKRERPIPDLRENGEETLASVYNLPLMLAIVLMAGGGLRYSEIFHLFRGDVRGTEVRLYHPSQGVVKSKGRKAYTREMYLRDTYGLKPRHVASGAQHTGWKHLLITETSEMFSRVHFLPGWGDLFLSIHSAYKTQLLPQKPTHPYLFISTDARHFGEPWTIGSFRKAYLRALGRIGLTQDSNQGTNPHGLRHRYGQTLVDMGISPLHIQVCMHHLSLESQLAYTQPSDHKVNKALKQAAAHMEKGDISTGLTLTPQQALGYSYKSDPAGLFSAMKLGEGRDHV